jgi:hypothetical protein
MIQLGLGATAESYFSWLHTRLAVERTRAHSHALFDFGFAIVQSFERMDQIHGFSPAAIQTLRGISY